MTENEAKQNKWNLDGVIKYLYKKNELGGDDNEKQYQVDNATLDLLEELQQYRAIGTAEECREAREGQRAKKPRFYAHNYYCGNCGNLVGNDEFKWKRYMYCDKCGHAVLWECDDE